MSASETNQIERKEWIEPEVRSLEIRETAAFTKLGNDAGTMGADCQRS